MRDVRETTCKAFITMHNRHENTPSLMHVRCTIQSSDQLCKYYKCVFCRIQRYKQSVLVYTVTSQPPVWLIKHWKIKNDVLGQKLIFMRMYTCCFADRISIMCTVLRLLKGDQRAWKAGLGTYMGCRLCCQISRVYFDLVG